MKSRTYTCEGCGQQHPHEFMLLCPQCIEEDAIEDRERRECPLCTSTVEADEEGYLDCPNCGCHLESRR